MYIRPKKNMCVSDRPTDPKFFYAKKNKIGKIRKFVSVSVFVSDFNNRRLTVAILMLPDKQLIETDLLKTGFLFEYTQVITKTLYCMSNN